MLYLIGLGLNAEKGLTLEAVEILRKCKKVLLESYTSLYFGDIKKLEETEIQLKPEDLKVETFRASGPGGQYVNRRESAVRITHLPTGLQASSQVERLQGLNRKRAMQILVAKFIAFKEREKREEIEKIKGKRVSVEFGSQIRSYVLHPYKLVKDHRTGVETSDIDSVLDGDLDRFIEAEMHYKS